MVYVIAVKTILDLATAGLFAAAKDWRHALLFLGFAVADVGSMLV